MEDFNTKIPLFKKIDKEIFTRIDKFKQTPNYNGLQDFYNGLEEEQQKVFKAVGVLILFLVPVIILSFFVWQNNNLRADLDMRVSIVAKSNQIIGQNQGLREVSPMVLSQSPIDSSSMMTSRLSNMLSSMGVDLSKIQVADFNSEMISTAVNKAEANFSFSNLSTDELMNLFTAMIQREKFRVSSVNIKKNPDTNLLQGQFHAIHYSSVTENVEED